IAAEDQEQRPESLFLGRNHPLRSPGGGHCRKREQAPDRRGHEDRNQRHGTPGQARPDDREQDVDSALEDSQYEDYTAAAISPAAASRNASRPRPARSDSPIGAPLHSPAGSVTCGSRPTPASDVSVRAAG